MIFRFLHFLGLDQHKSLGRLVSDIAWVLVGIGSLLAGALLVNMILARLLSTASMGEYLFMMSLVNFLIIPAGLGMSQIMVREIAKHLARGEANQAAGLFPPALKLLSASTLLVGLGIVLAGTASGYSFTLMAMVALLTALTSWLNISGETLRGMGNFRMASLVSSIMPRTLTVILLIPLLLGAAALSETQALGLLSAGALVALALALWRIQLWRAKIKREHGSVSPGLWQLYQVAWPLLGVNACVSMFASLDIWVLRGLSTASQVAIYGTAARLAFMLTLFPGIARTVVNPRIASLHAQGRRQELELLIRLASSVSAVLALGCVLVFLFFGGPILGLLFGPGYEAGAPVLVILGLGYLAESAMGLAVVCLTMGGYQRPLFLTSLWILLVTVALAVVSAWFLGPLGLAGAMVVGLVLRNLVTLFLAHRLMGIWTHPYWRLSDLARLRAFLALMRTAPEVPVEFQDS